MLSGPNVPCASVSFCFLNSCELLRWVLQGPCQSEQLASCWIYWEKPKPQELACPNAGNAAASDHRQLGIEVWGHTRNLVRFEQATQQKKRVGKTELMGIRSIAPSSSNRKSWQRSITLRVFRFQSLFHRKENAFERRSSFIHSHLAHDASF
jgi:hypothetical protein